MSFQAGDDLMLKRMKRRHSRAQAIETVARLKARRPEIAIGADLIAGFPTETDEMHGNSLRLIDECDIVMAHIFPFSPKKGTPAARMPQVQPKALKARARRLREAAARRKGAWLEGLVGTRQNVLVEKEGFGHAENFAPVQIAPSPSMGEGRGGGERLHPRGPARLLTLPQPVPIEGRGSAGVVIEVEITGVDGDTLVGIPA
jgi:threonylcarbamoyladenosine tRNA methylthiotransferase MtaB